MSRSKGDEAEAKAILFLQKKGFIIVESNYYSRFGEIDIIATKDGVLHFIEVKSAREYEGAIYNITPKKVERIVKTSQVYLKKNALDMEFCYDAVIVTPNAIELIENILV
ncbi:putative protein [hydrothermal vent metagenome]|uniref:Uncharacterized protein n=1 Tax=hydrothermal vent metagenome TaxID=652676 RepID=A0A1W1B8R1_9ZZZZ